MTSGRIATLLAAAITTVVAGIASIDRWAPIAPFLRAAAIGTWIVFAVHTTADRILDAVRKLHDDITNYGDQRHSDGIISGIQHATPPQQTIRGLR